eukprot:jgi/Ulvmu1/11846/UM081_0004.1
MTVTPAEIRKIDVPTQEYMCTLYDGRNLNFLEFDILDDQSGAEFYRVEREADSVDGSEDVAPEIEELIRHVHYTLPSAMLRCERIKTRLKFALRAPQVEDLLLIERHYFKGKLVRNYENSFRPDGSASTQIWEVTYDMPQYSEQEITEFVRSLSKLA